MGSSLILTGGAATTKTLKEEIAQTAHGFTVGSVLRWDYSQGKYALAKADTALNAEVVGVVNELSDANNFYLTYSGYIEIPTLSGGSYPVLFLSGTTAGELSSSPPSFIGSVVKPVLSRSTNGAGHIVMNYLGTQIGGSSTVAIDEIQPVGSVMPFAGDAIPDTWLECNGASYAVSDYAELYEKLRYVSGDRVPLYGYVATLTGTNVSSVLSVGDFIQYKTTSTAWSGTGSPLTGSNANILAVVLSVTATTAVVQTLPIYSNSKFTSTSTVFGNGGFVGSETGTGNYRAYTAASAFKAVSLTITAAAVTHFNTPDLRARFPVGVNTSPIGESEADNTFNSALSAFALGEEGGSESLGTIINVATWNATSAEPAVPSGSSVIKPPYLATKYIIKAKPYARAAIVDGLDIPYSQLLVRDLRSRNVGGSNGDLVFYTNTAGDSGSGTERMLINTSGLVGIGNTNPAYRLTVKGGEPYGSFAVVEPSTNATRIVLTVTSTGVSFGSTYFATPVPIGFHIGSSEIARFDTSGRFGIGTTGPTTTLDVNGTVRIRGGGAPAIKLSDRLVAADTSGTLKWDTDLIENIDSTNVGFNTTNTGWTDTLSGTTVNKNQDISARTAIYTADTATLKRGVYFCQPYNNLTYSPNFRASAAYYGRIGIQAISGTIVGVGSDTFPGINHHFNYDTNGSRWNNDLYTAMPYEFTPFLVFVTTDTAVVKGVFTHQQSGTIRTVGNASVGMTYYLYRIS